MKNKRTTPQTPDRFRIRGKTRTKHRLSTSLIAASLAVLLAFSALNANIISIIDLLNVKAAATDYFVADLELYDYYGTGSGGDIWFHPFNQKLYDSGYMTGGDAAKGWGNGSGETQYLFSRDSHNASSSYVSGANTYYPLFLGLQYISQNNSNDYCFPYFQGYNGEDVGGKSSNMGHGFPNERYNYSLAANSNSYGDAVVQDLVDDTLSGDRITQGNGRVVLPYFDNSFVSGSVGQVESLAKFRFRKHRSGQYAGMYVYDSENDGLTEDTVGSTKRYTAATDGKYYKDTKHHYGFFPLENGSSADYASNYGFGGVFTLSFTLSEDGRTSSGDDMIFSFRGDDDVWVFIDNQLVLDLGGAHTKCSGRIIFTQDEARAVADRAVKKDRLSFDNRGNNVSGNVDEGVTTDLNQLFEDLEMYGDSTKKHKMKVFYLERGTLESNCLITFNFTPSDTLTVYNHVDTSDVNPKLLEETEKAVRKDAIQYQLQNKGPATEDDSPDDRMPGANYNVPLSFPVEGGGQQNPEEKVTLTYVDHGGNTIASNRYNKGRNITIRSKVPGLTENQVFRGWSTNQSATTADPAYAPGTIITLNNDLTLYAKVGEIVNAPNQPTLLFLRHDDSCGRTPGFESGGNSSQNLMTSLGNNWYGFVLTNWSLPDSGAYVQHNQFHGGSDSQYSFAGSLPDNQQIDQGEYVFVFLNNNSNSNCSVSSCSYNVYDYQTNGLPNSWIRAYVKLYHSLVNSKEVIDGNDALDKTTYNNCLNTYNNATFSTSESTLTAACTSLGAAYGSSVVPNMALPPDLSDELEPGNAAPNWMNDPDDPAMTDGTDGADDPAEPEDQTSDPVEVTQPVSGDVTPGIEGHWVGSPDSYANVVNTNYQLKYANGSNTVLRQTCNDANGQFNLVAEQMAIFSNQFTRNSRLKLAQTGRSWYFQYPQAYNTSIMGSPGVLFTDINNVADGNLGKRYSTTSRLYDVSDSGAIQHTTSSHPAYAVYNDSEPGGAGASEIDFAMNNLADNAEASDMVHLVAEFTNKVRVTSLCIYKEMTEEARAIPGSENLTFKFEVRFKDIFGDKTGQGVSYDGIIYINGTEQNLSSTNGIFQLKYGQTAEIRGIPIYTSFMIIETPPSDDSDVVWQVGKGTSRHAVTAAGSVANAESELSFTKDSAGRFLSSWHSINDCKPKEGDNDQSIPNISKALARYTGYKGDTDYSYMYIVNDIKNNKAYIILRKSIDHLYYFTQLGDNDSDDTAGLFSKYTTEAFKPTVGGAATTRDDVNGYQAATDAEQTFIFKIVEYANNDFTGETKTFYETLSFSLASPTATDPANVTSGLSGRYAKNCVIKADPNKSYKIYEMNDWSWKYSHDPDPEQTDPFNINIFSEDAYYYYVEGNEYKSKKYANAFLADFENDKNPLKREVEGDVSIVHNDLFFTFN